MRRIALAIGFLVALLSLNFGAHAQKSSPQEPGEGTLNRSHTQPFISLLPTPITQHLTVGISFQKVKTSQTLYLRIGQILQGVFYASIMTEHAFIIAQTQTRFDKTLSLRIPIWLGVRGLEYFNRGDIEGDPLEGFPFYTGLMVQAGTGIELQYDYKKRISFRHQCGIGVGPRLNVHHSLKSISVFDVVALPKLDLSLVIWLGR